VITPRTDSVVSIQSRIAEEIGPQRYKVWFKNATQFSLADGHLKISTPNSFICGWIERHFADTIAEAARQATGGDLQISFVVDTKLLNALRKRQLNSQADFIAKNPERVARQYRRLGAPPPPRLRGRFEDMIAGPANELAISVVKRLADRDPAAYTPVFVHGGCGVGKTHLLHALGNHLAEHHPDCRWLYVTGDEFTNAFIHALQAKQIEAFRQQYRNVDVLIIDDVHFLANKKATQEEFLHTFNTIDGQQKQVVLASDSHPKLIGQFSEQLVTRFLAGMVVRIDVPDFRMRCAILNHRVRLATSQPIPPEVITYIAEHLQANVRELEGALLKLVMFSRVSRQPITLSLARHALTDHLARTVRALGLDDIDQVVATYFGLTPADLHTSRKTRTLALARNIAMYLARKHTRMSFPEIGRSMGNKNHSTVILANRKIERLLDADEVVARQTPAGLKEEKLREIVTGIEEQIARQRTGHGPVAAVQPLHVPTSAVADRQPRLAIG
jgi:chromosomal replication initiator protein